MLRQRDCSHPQEHRTAEEYVHRPDGIVRVRTVCGMCDHEINMDIPETEEFKAALEKDWTAELPEGKTFHDVVSHVDEEASDITSVVVVLEVYVEGQYEPELERQFLFEA